MSTKRIVTLIDDVDGTDAVETIQFALDGVEYEIDLSEKNASEMRDAMALWVGSARRIKGGKRRSAPREKPDYDPAEVREWARSQGIEVGSRGLIHQGIVNAYRAGH